MLQGKKDIVSKLQQNIMLWEGFKAPSTGTVNQFGLGIIEASFANGVFPTGAIHEFLNFKPEHAAASGGFVAGLLQPILKASGICLWIGTSRTIFPVALAYFGVSPDRVVFIDAIKEKDVLWATEEALKCNSVAAVVAEVSKLSFAQSRRLQLAVEKSSTTGFILRNDPNALSTTTCVARWRITPLPSAPEDGMPGVGFPRWNVELIKVRNGNSGVWQVEWRNDRFLLVTEQENTSVDVIRKVG
ncbi:Error-prone repair protein ImuA [Mucilaginibacter sp. Bleaf8]|uniref:ImuA family protein n=1 Tax=Mucilaginibacter sp. Bleaf8 TaxID=2834430 RepID=UPI001BCABB21|nr:Error-prone repair protein ImuA [Mucilaginibacter sp. Bleaf8]MBS7563821.1 Error-prone repair protein ImuA [Mucilaginibacter sp. Bleaf8]